VADGEDRVLHVIDDIEPFGPYDLARAIETLPRADARDPHAAAVERERGFGPVTGLARIAEPLET
jgi:hypothetical protein